MLEQETVREEKILRINTPFYQVWDSFYCKTYQDFIKDNPGSACLNIRASSANFAVPIDNVKIIVSKVIDNYNVILDRKSVV